MGCGECTALAEKASTPQPIDGALELLPMADEDQLYWRAIVAAGEQIASHRERGPYETSRAEAVQQGGRSGGGSSTGDRSGRGW